MNTKLNFTDTGKDILIKMSEGNPGCLTFLVELMKLHDMEFVGCCLKLDSVGMYGSEIYQLWNDCCDRDTEKTKEVIMKYSGEELLSHVRNGQGYGSKFN